MDFWATLLGSAIGAAVGVVAGAAIQYLTEIWLKRHDRNALLSDLRIEAQCNLDVLNDMHDEVVRFRTAAQPDTFATYRWIYRAKDLLWIAFNQLLQSGQLYRTFTQREIAEIRSLQQFFTHQVERLFVGEMIAKLQATNDIPGAHQLADQLEQQIRNGIAALNIIANKR